MKFDFVRILHKLRYWYELCDVLSTNLSRAVRNWYQWLCFFGTKTAYAAASPATPAYADHMTGDG